MKDDMEPKQSHTREKVRPMVLLKKGLAPWAAQGYECSYNWHSHG